MSKRITVKDLKTNQEIIYDSEWKMPISLEVSGNTIIIKDKHGDTHIYSSQNVEVHEVNI